LQQSDAPAHMEPLVAAAGKAAEWLLFRELGQDESQASSGAADEQELESALRRNFRSVTDENLAEAKRIIEEFAMRLLQDPACWTALKSLAEDLLRDTATLPDVIRRTENQIHPILAKAFASATA